MEGSRGGGWMGRGGGGGMLTDKGNEGMEAHPPILGAPSESEKETQRGQLVDFCRPCFCDLNRLIREL